MTVSKINLYTLREDANYLLKKFPGLKGAFLGIDDVTIEKCQVEEIGMNWEEVRDLLIKNEWAKKKGEKQISLTVDLKKETDKIQQSNT